jgi:hypothetical protein
VTAAITAGVGVYLLFGKTHPISFLALEISFALLVVMVFAAFKRLRSTEIALAELDKRHNQLRAVKETLFAQMTILESRVKDEQEAFQKMVIKKDAEQSENVRLLSQYKDDRDKEQADRERLETSLMKSRSSTPSPTQQTASIFPSLSMLNNQTPRMTFNAREYFRLAYYSPVTVEMENAVRVIADNYDPNDHEVFYARFLGVGVVAYGHDITWAYIYGSQLLLLVELNRIAKIVPVSTSRKYFDEAVTKYPEIYANYTFEQWLEWIRGQGLIACYPSEMMEISHAGKDFLKYLAHWGRDLSAKKG